MKISKDSGYISYGQRYAIFHDEGTQVGIFFRLPIRKVCYHKYTETKNDPSLFIWIEDCKRSKLFRFFNYLLGNKDQVTQALEDIDLLEDDDLCDMQINRIISPIYFKRNYRALTIINMEEDSAINYIDSFGYDDEWNQVSGHCNKEVTKIHHQYKRTETRLRSGKTYLYTYLHIAKELIKTLEARELKDKTIKPCGRG